MIFVNIKSYGLDLQKVVVSEGSERAREGEREKEKERGQKRKMQQMGKDIRFLHPAVSVSLPSIFISQNPST